MRDASQGQLLTKLTVSVLRTAWQHKLYTIQIVVFLAGGYLAATAKTEAAYILGNHSQTAMATSLIAVGIADRRIRSAGLLESDLRRRYDTKNEALERDKARLAEDSSKAVNARAQLLREISDFEVKRDNYRDSIKISLEKANEVTKQRIERDLRIGFDHQTQALETEYKRLETALKKEVETEKIKAARAVSVAQEEAEKVKRDAEVATQRANEIMAECAADKAGVSQAAKQKIQEVIGINQAEKKEFARVLKGTNSCFDDERMQVNLRFQQLSHQVVVKDTEIDRLMGEVRRLQETRFSPGGTDEAKLCRRMHKWLERELDVTLHHLRIDFLGDGVHRFCFKNQTRSLDDFQKVKGGLASFLSVPIEKIDQNFDESSIEITVRLARKSVLKEDDINRLCRSDKAYLERSMHWARVQFLAPSETGKTSSAEILANQFTEAKKGQIYFHFPNENSIKNYVVSPIASMGTDECIEAFSTLVRRVDHIQGGKESPPERFEYHIFDDSDSVISQAIKQGLTRQEILDFFTRASHCQIGFCLIGHSTAANNFPGFTHSDFNNLVRVYAGNDIMTALQNTQIISEDRAKSLRVQYEKIRDYFDSKNKDLGLVTSGTSADPQAYRFALVIELTGKPYFCQLPRLDLLSNNTSDPRNDTESCGEGAKQDLLGERRGKNRHNLGREGETGNSGYCPSVSNPLGAGAGAEDFRGRPGAQQNPRLESASGDEGQDGGKGEASQKPSKPTPPTCPHCGSRKVQNKDRNDKTIKYLCKNPNHDQNGKGRKTFYRDAAGRVFRDAKGEVPY